MTDPGTELSSYTFGYFPDRPRTASTYGTYVLCPRAVTNPRPRRKKKTYIHTPAISPVESPVKFKQDSTLTSARETTRHCFLVTRQLLTTSRSRPVASIVTSLFNPPARQTRWGVLYTPGFFLPGLEIDSLRCRTDRKDVGTG